METQIVRIENKQKSVQNCHKFYFLISFLKLHNYNTEYFNKISLLY
jgi:hypothetical protein